MLQSQLLLKPFDTEKLSTIFSEYNVFVPSLVRVETLRCI